MSTILVPVVREYLADTLTPISIFKDLESKGACFLLESVERGEHWGRYSIIGLNPQAEIIVSGGRIITKGKIGEVDMKKEGPLESLKLMLDSYRLAEGEGVDMPPFAGGLVGFFAYDILRYYKNLPGQPIDDMGFPDAHFFLVTQSILYDHLKNILMFIHFIPKEKDSKEYRKLIWDQADEIMGGLGRDREIDISIDNTGCVVTGNITRAEYLKAVGTAKEYIRKGEVLQVVLSQRKTYTPAPDPFIVYRRLRSLNPSPYMYYMNFGEYQIVGSSPECLARLQGDVVESFPIAGTRPRGATAAEDARLARELVENPKERAEHAMLVDLGRNDIERISKFGSVTVEDYMHVESFSHVMHMVSRVKGCIAPGQSAFDVLLSCFPAGTVSGAPKLRAMEIIDELETTRRGPYGGAVGYFDFRGSMDTCITIRTLFFKGRSVHIQAGAGIVADSIPEMEYLETLNKLKALSRALNAEADGEEDLETMQTL